MLVALLFVTRRLLTLSNDNVAADLLVGVGEGLGVGFGVGVDVGFGVGVIAFPVLNSPVAPDSTSIFPQTVFT